MIWFHCQSLFFLHEHSLYSWETEAHRTRLGVLGTSDVIA